MMDIHNCYIECIFCFMKKVAPLPKQLCLLSEQCKTLHQKHTIPYILFYEKGGTIAKAIMLIVKAMYNFILEAYNTIFSKQYYGMAKR